MSDITKKLKIDNVAVKVTNDRRTKVERQMAFERACMEEEGIDSNALEIKLKEKQSLLHSIQSFTGEKFQVPKVRFGRTNLDISILTLGGMRQQETWAPKDGLTLTEINAECQANFEMIADRAIEMGINHFETARGYGSSELQFGPVIKKYSRRSIILQTKVVPKSTNEEFRKLLETSFAKLQLEEDDAYVDLLSFHGVNKPEHLDYILRDGGNMEVVKEYQAKGKVKFIGFSTHGMTSCIVKAIESNAFDYVNLHHHFIGSYTASGTGMVHEGNMDAIVAAKQRDMGIFIISPVDKGGALYEPPRRLATLCSKHQVSPMAFADLWLWAQGAHTLTIGAARPTDFDEHLHASSLFERREEISEPIHAEWYAYVEATFGASFTKNWWKGLISAYENDEGVPVAHIYWLWWMCKAWGMYHYALKRYSSLEGNEASWAKEGLSSFSWVPGVPFTDAREPKVREALKEHPNREHVIQSLREAHQWLKSGGCVKRGEAPIGDVDITTWEVAYDMQPDVPFPER